MPALARRCEAEPRGSSLPSDLSHTERGGGHIKGLPGASRLCKEGIAEALCSGCLGCPLSLAHCVSWVRMGSGNVLSAHSRETRGSASQVIQAPLLLLLLLLSQSCPAIPSHPAQLNFISSNFPPFLPVPNHCLLPLCFHFWPAGSSGQPYSRCPMTD